MYVIRVLTKGLAEAREKGWYADQFFFASNAFEYKEKLEYIFGILGITNVIVTITKEKL